MKAETKTNVGIKFHTQAWMQVENPDITMDEAVKRAKALGNTIIEVDEEGRRIKVTDSVSHPEDTIYTCDNCGAYSRSYNRTEEHEQECIEMNDKNTNVINEGGG